jgi:hypothetical protein
MKLCFIGDHDPGKIRTPNLQRLSLPKSGALTIRPLYVGVRSIPERKRVKLLTGRTETAETVFSEIPYFNKYDY